MSEKRVCHSGNGSLYRSEECLFQCLVEIRKSLGETFGLESQIVHGVFQLFGRLVLAAVLQAFRNITELCGPELAFQFDDGHRKQQLDGFRVADTVFLPVSGMELDQVYTVILLLYICT